MPTIGQFIDRRYELTELADKGGTATQADVYYARDHLLDEEVVIRIARDPRDIESFRSQYRQLRAQGRSLVRGYAYGEAEVNGTSQPYVVIESLRDGLPIGEWAKRAATPELILRLADLADAIADIHHAGNIHGDITENNILVCGDRVVLIDPDSKYGALRGHSVGANTNTDYFGFASVVETLLPREFHSLARPRADISLTTRAFELRNLARRAAQTGLLGYADMKTTFDQKRKADDETFSRYVEFRHAVIRGVRDDVSLALSELNDRRIVLKDSNLEDLILKERTSISNAVSSLEQLGFSVQTDVGDQLIFQLDAPSPREFVRPWPQRWISDSIVSVGRLCVFRGGVIEPSSDYAIKLVEEEESLRFLVGRRDGLVPEVLQRLLGVLMFGPEPPPLANMFDGIDVAQIKSLIRACRADVPHVLWVDRDGDVSLSPITGSRSGRDWLEHNVGKNTVAVYFETFGPHFVGPSAADDDILSKRLVAALNGNWDPNSLSSRYIDCF